MYILRAYPQPPQPYHCRAEQPRIGRARRSGFPRRAGCWRGRIALLTRPDRLWNRLFCTLFGGCFLVGCGGFRRAVGCVDGCIDGRLDGRVDGGDGRGDRDPLAGAVAPATRSFVRSHHSRPI
ncbi:uncharacterized protein K441DRAFT_356738 [Cenococcum geophilum 1.58]|uniref:Uncharacterized protein n=1 Tax=Cenococcum geophilum 1.58 TaxID=794803 RepID=A0ACC8EMN2_9PEZI|nr:hypothetical protein K441DRAFT_356738 [Cenococcum geophilum 1.58]